jgi:hypothetical protein
MAKLRSLAGSDRHGELVERNGPPPVRWLLGGQLVVSPKQALDDGMHHDHQP